MRRSGSAGPLCPRCWRRARRTHWSDGDYAFLLGVYLGDGCISDAGRSFRLRISLDARHPGVIADARAVLRRGFPANRVGEVRADEGSTVILSVYSAHMPCLLPQHGPGPKHRRRIELEPWQEAAIAACPYDFLRGCIWSDGCTFINHTGPYAYLTYDFCNYSDDIRGIFRHACDLAGIEYRMNADRVRINRRGSVQRLHSRIGTKR
jgi:hypothetical protein